MGTISLAESDWRATTRRDKPPMKVSWNKASAPPKVRCNQPLSQSESSLGIRLSGPA